MDISENPSVKEQVDIKTYWNQEDQQRPHHIFLFFCGAIKSHVFFFLHICFYISITVLAISQPWRLNNEFIEGRSQDGGGIGRGDHFLFYKFIERTTER